MKKRSFLIIFVVLAVVLCSCGNEEAINSSGGNDFMEEIFSHFEETLKENEDSADENNKTDEYGSTVYGEGKITDDIVIEFKDFFDNGKLIEPEQFEIKEERQAYKEKLENALKPYY